MSEHVLHREQVLDAPLERTFEFFSRAENLEAITPPDDIYSLHICLIRHGRRVCRAPTPRCPACAVRELCPYPAKSLAIALEETS